MKLRAVYKIIDTAEIDADVYLPSDDWNRGQEYPVGKLAFGNLILVSEDNMYQ